MRKRAPGVSVCAETCTTPNGQPMSLNDAWEPLYTCVRLLATVRGYPRERLIEASLGPLSQLRDGDFPENLIGQWRSIQSRILAVTAGGPKEVVEAAAGSVEEATVIEIIRDIVSLYNSVTVAYAIENAALELRSG